MAERGRRAWFGRIRCHGADDTSPAAALLEVSEDMVVDSRELGFADLHMHQFAHLAFGGHFIWGLPSGPPADSLPSCRPRHGPHGLLDVVGNVSRAMLTDGSWAALLGHDTNGYPDYAGWPCWDDLSHQSIHETMLKRAVDGGLRLAVMVALNNRVLCRL